MPRYYRYIYFDPRTDTAIYAGKGQDDRPYDHLKWTHNKRFRNKLTAIRRAGFEPVIDVLEAPTNYSACAQEIFWIAVFGRVDLGTGTLYNMTSGGENGGAGRIWSSISKQKIIDANLGKKRKSGTGENISKAKKAAMNDQTREKIRQAKLGVPQSEAAKLKLSEHFKGRSRTYKDKEAARENYRTAAQARPKEHYDKIAASRIGYRSYYDPITLETKQFKSSVEPPPESWLLGNPHHWRKRPK